MDFKIGVEAIAHVIQLAVAPVFLLTGIGALLNVLISRLGRIIDRGRKIEAMFADAAEDRRAGFDAELDTLARRAKRVYWAITLCTLSALLVCSVIVTAFMGAFLATDVSFWVAWLFILALLALIGALVSFLREIVLATRSLRIRSMRHHQS